VEVGREKDSDNMTNREARLITRSGRPAFFPFLSLPFSNLRISRLQPNLMDLEVDTSAGEADLNLDLNSGGSTPNSLFDEADELPPIPGLYLPSCRIPAELEAEIFNFCSLTYFNKPGADQVMLFGNMIPSPLRNLLDTVSALLGDSSEIPEDIHNILFRPLPGHARQAIINMYCPGQGISPHVDLVGRYGDGIFGVSMGSGCAMAFKHVANEEGVNAPDEHEVYLPRRSIVALTGEARYDWTHGIPSREVDGDQPRQKRISVTFRWLLPNADVVGS
jgi:hypothetical protein